MSQAGFSRACQPCKKRKSRCGKVKPCPSCVCHETQDDCYGDLYIEKCPQWSVSATSSTGQRTSESSSTSGSSLQTPLDIDMLDMHVIKEECEWPFEQTTHSDWTCLPAHLIPPSVDFMEPLIMTEDLPPLAPFPPINELEAAIYCYITEMQWQMVSVDERMRKAFRRFVFTGKASWLEQAFFYTILAIVGKVIVDTNLCTQARYIRNANVQKQYIETAKLVMEVEGTLEEDDTDKIETNQSDLLLKAQIECLEAFYCILSSDIDGAIKQFERSTRYGEQAGIFDVSSSTSSNAETGAMRRFAVELAVPAVWLSTLNGQVPPSVLERVKEYTPSPCDEPVEVEILQSKVIGIGVLINTQRILSDKGPMTLEKARGILQLDKIINEILERPAIRFSRDFTGPYITDTVNYQKLFTSSAIRQTHFTLRCGLLQKLCRMSIASSSHQKLLEVASASLQETRNTWIVLQAPWHKIGRMSRTSLHAEVAMSAFASALEKDDYLSFPRRTLLGKRYPDGSSTSQLAAFVNNFDRTYNLLNTLGLLSPSTLRCAEMIKMAPIKPSLSIDRATDLDGDSDADTPEYVEGSAMITEVQDSSENLFNVNAQKFSDMLYNLLQKGFEVDTADAFLLSLEAM